jgi:hypothetical protein
MIRDGSLTGRTGYGFSYVIEDVLSGGYPWVTSTGATQSTSVGAILRNNTANMCGGSMCHGNPTPPAGSSYDASGSSWGTYLEFYRPWDDYGPIPCAEGDSDSDGICDDVDNCVDIPNHDQADADGDGTGDNCDPCPNDPFKTDPGICGCGVADTDSDGDGTPDCNDGCPNDPFKTDPGICGCGVADTDSDGDGTPDCNDGCPNDPFKTDPGICGCGVADDDSDGDGTLDCNDGCPNDPDKIEPGICGCGVAETDPACLCPLYTVKRDCNNDPTCEWQGNPQTGQCVEKAVCTPSAPDEVGACGDGVDNDCDGLTDCADTVDCGNDPACQVDCSVYTDKQLCNNQPNCIWDNRNKVCIDL